MTHLLQFLKSLVARAGSKRNTDEAYLAESVDIYDLERRMRDLDERRRGRSSGMACGLVAR